MRGAMMKAVVLLLVALTLSPVVNEAFAQATTVVTCTIQDKNGDGLNDIVFQAADNTGPRAGVEVDVFLETSLIFNKTTDALGEANIYDPPAGTYSWTSANGQSGTLQIGDPTFSIDDVEEVLQWLVAVDFMNSQNKERSLCQNIAKVLGYDLSANPLPTIDGTNSHDNTAIATAWINWQNGLIEHIDSLKSTNVLSSELSKTFLDILVATSDGLSAAKDWKETDQTTMEDVGVQGGEELELATPETKTTVYDYAGGGLALASIVFSSLDILHLSSTPTSVETVNPSGVTIDTRPIQIYADGLTIFAGFGNLIESLVKEGNLKSMGTDFATIFGVGAAAFSAAITIAGIYEELQGKGLTEDLTDPQLWIQTLILVKDFAEIGVGLVTYLGWESIDTIGDVSLSTLGSTLAGIASVIGLAYAYYLVIKWWWDMIAGQNEASAEMSPLLTQLWQIRSALNGIDPKQLQDDSTHSLDLSKAAGELIDQIDAAGTSDAPIMNLRGQLYSAKHYWANLATAEDRLANDASNAVSKIDGFFASACYVPTTFNIMTAHVSGILSVPANCETSSSFSVNASYYQPTSTNPSLGEYMEIGIMSTDGLSQDLSVSEGSVDPSYISRQETNLLGQKYPAGWAWDVPTEQDASGNKLAVFYRPQSSFSPSNFLFDSDGSGTQYDDYYKSTALQKDQAGNLRPYYKLKFYFDNYYPDGLSTMQNTLFDKTNGMLNNVQSAIQQAEDSLNNFEQASIFKPYDIHENIESGLSWLSKQQNPVDGSWNAVGTSVGATSLAVMSLINYEGSLSLIDPAVAKGLNYILSQRDKSSGSFGFYLTYETSLAIMALSAAKSVGYSLLIPNMDQYITDAMNWLLSNQNIESNLQITPDNKYYGGWGYYGKDSSWADLSNTQFAAIALSAAESSLKIPPHLTSWEAVATFVARCNNNATNNPQYYYTDDGGFIYQPQSTTRTYTGASYGSMTAAGVWVLGLARMAGVTQINMQVETIDSMSSILSGLNWLSDHYSVTQNPVDYWWGGNSFPYYYFWSVAKAWEITGQTTVAGHDWYTELKNNLAVAQLTSTDGRWLGTGDEEPDLLATEWAILALELGTVPQPILQNSKLVVTLHSGADLHVYDQLGRHVGYNYTTQQNEIQIPNATYSGHGTEPQIITIPLTQGLKYTVEVVGTTGGSYELAVDATTSDVVVAERSFNGTTSPGATLQYNAEVVTIAGLSLLMQPPLVTQYQITFDQTGVGSDFATTVVTIDGTNYTASDLPTSFLWNNGSTHTFAFQSPLLASSGAKEYDWASTTGLSTLQADSITVSGAGNVTGNYVTRVHDVAVTNVTIDRTWVYQGFNANMNVTILNEGDFDENVTVTLYYNITANKIIGAQNVTLSPGQNETVAFVWNTAGVPYCQNYTITAVASIPADNNPADNTLDGGPVRVRILGDMNGDATVDIYDAIMFANYFGLPKGDARWNVDADMNRDGVTDIFDAIMIARHFGISSSS